MHVCTHCGRHFSVPSKDEKFFNLDTPVFDAPECLRAYVESLPRLMPSDPLFGTTVFDRLPEQSMGSPMCRSFLLDTSFRSGFEVITAETMVLGWGWQAYYEPHAIAISAKKSYVPDFYVPHSGCWIEVKGCWHSGDKRKFIKAAELIGAERVILVPNYYRKWFVRGAAMVRQECVVEDICR